MLKSFFRLSCFILFSFISFKSQAQTLSFDELLTTIQAKGYPDKLYDTLEAQGFYRIDKLYPEGCVRVMYVLEKGGKSNQFASTHYCLEPFQNEYLPLSAKNQLELQYQRAARPDFEKLSAAIRKYCKPLNQKKPVNKKVQPKYIAYLHEASGIRFIVCNIAPVAYIYLLR